MTIKARRWNALIAIAGLAGMVLLATRQDPALAGILAGAALIAAISLLIVDRRLAQLAEQAQELSATRAQYEAAYATLAGQRERLRSSMDEQVAEQLEARNAAHQQELLKARVEAYTQGAIHALNGRLAVPTGGDAADVISLNAHRKQAVPLNGAKD